MFTHQSSFPRLVRGVTVQDRLQVSNVFQKTSIVNNENGNTATESNHDATTENLTGIPEFNANHPFLFIIENDISRTLLFTGKIVKPEHSK